MILIIGSCTHKKKTFPFYPLALVGVSSDSSLSSALTSLTVTSTNPDNESINVSVNSNITFNFSSSLDTSTVNQQTFKLQTSTGGSSISTSISVNGSTAILKPTALLLLNTGYQAIATTGIQDMSRNSIKSTKSISFTSSNTCPATYSVCNTNVCVNKTSDPLNCGSCGNACITNAVCVSSVCQCPVGSISCPSGCSDLTTDTNNCGSCSNKCATGLSCVSGQCI